MSDEAPKITLKGGTGYDAPWITIPFANVGEAKAILQAVRDELLEDVVSTAELFKAAVAATPLTQPQAVPAQTATVTQGPWGQQPAAPQQQAAPVQNPAVAGHPEGKSCTACGKPLEAKTTTSGKHVFRCPDWRWGNGNPNQHTQEWA